MEPAIRVENLEKDFWLRQPTHGWAESVRHFFRPRYHSVKAVNRLSFEVQPGERVAFIGPNGAGKSTTIKMLTGILYPSAGHLSVLGLLPWKERQRLGYKIGTVFGQRSQLWYHLPAHDTFDLLARIYDLDDATYRKRRAELVALFRIENILNQTVRKLSLGQRMRCEIVASLLHQPDILFLDEPTIGLDVTAKAVIRDLIKERSLIDRTTIFLTSHDTGDVERVCDRVIVIHDGELLLDQSIQSLRVDYIHKKLITLHTVEERIELDLPGIHVVERSPHQTHVEVDVAITPVDAVIDKALKVAKLQDLTVADPPMEEIVKTIYAEG